MIDITTHVKIDDMSKININTLMLFRCTTLEYANKFLETGNIRFGLPKEWIDSYKKVGAGRGDLLEGAFASIEKIDKRPIDFYKALRPNVKISENSIEGFYYFQSFDVLNMRTFCLFGLNDNMFSSHIIAEDKRFYPSGKISKKYFQDFAPKITKENYDKLEPNERPVLLMINNPHEFFNRMRKFLYSLGLNDNEFIIHPVGYTDKHKQFFVGDAIPGELFIKDSTFDYQSEIRIVICSLNSRIIKKIDEMDGIFNIGPMKDIADIQDYYFEDFIMQRRGDNFLFSLSKPKTIECSKEELIGFINQILCNRILEGMSEGNFTKEEQITLTAKNLKVKYHISFDRDSLTFFADENYRPSGPDDCGRKWTLNGVDDVLSGDGCLLLERGEYSEAIQNFTDAIDINPSRSDFWYNRGVAYFMQSLYDEALADYSKAIELNSNNTKYYFERANVYNKLMMPQNAKVDYNDGIKAYGDINDHRYDNYDAQKLLFDFAIASQTTDKYDVALLAISKCIELQFNIPEVYNIQGNIYISLNQLDQALECYKIYLQKNGDRFNAYLNIGVAYMKSGIDNNNKEKFLLSLEYINKAKSILSTPMLESNLRRWFINAFIHFGLDEDKFKRAIIDEFEYKPEDKSIKKLYEVFIQGIGDDDLSVKGM